MLNVEIVNISLDPVLFSLRMRVWLHFNNLIRCTVPKKKTDCIPSADNEDDAALR